MDIDQLSEWIGKEESAEEELTSALVSRFAATFDLSCKTEKSVIAPSLIHLCLCPPAHATTELGPDGHPKRGGFLPPVPLPNRMWAGGSFTYYGNLFIGDLISRQSTIKDIYEKNGRSGKLCFVEVEHKIYSGDNHAITEIHNIVYKDHPKNSETSKNQLKADRGAYTKRQTPSSTLLFRYSALTFNGHRIHYDAPYAKEREHYPGLVVHGPLQATLLFQFAEKIKQARPSRFTYRNLSTLFDKSDFILNAEETETGLDLWTSQDKGPIAMQAHAVWD